MTTEVKTYLTPGQSQALYAHFVKDIRANEDSRKLLFNMAFVILPAIILIGFNVVMDGVFPRILSSLMLLFVALAHKPRSEPDTRSAIIDAIDDLSVAEEYEIYARAVADPSELGQLIAAILMESDDDVLDKPSARVRIQLACKGKKSGEPCGHTFGVIVHCPAWGIDTCYADCPHCGCSNEFVVDGSMVDDRSEIARLEAVGKPAVPVALIADTSTMRLDDSQVRVQVLR